MRKLLNTKKNVILWLESLLLVLCTLGFLYKTCGVYFETNDDRMINEILSGVLTGTPDGHAIFVNYILGSILAFLYSLSTEIPWYGGLLICSHAAVYWCFGGLLLERCQNLFQHLLGLVCTCFFMLSNLYIFGEIQYTSTAAVLAAGGYLFLLLDQNTSRKYVFFAFFELLALLLRSQGMLMIQIPGLSILGFSFLALWLRKKKKLQELLKPFLITIGILFACLGISWVGNHVLSDYNSSQWQEYTYFREIRGDMADYYGFPAYEGVTDILEKYDVSETEYVAFTRYWMLGNVLDISCLEELHEVAEANYNASRGTFTDILHSLFTSRFQGGIMGYGKYTLMLYAFVGMLMLTRRKWTMLFSLVGLNIGRNMALGYLIYCGRLPLRVLSGLYFVEMLFLLAWLFLLLQDIRKEKLWLQLGTFLVAMAVISISADTVKDTYEGLYWTHQNRKSYTGGMDDIIDYCINSDAGYITVEMATTYYTGEALDMSWYKNRNYLTCGFWWSTSPHISAYQKEYIDAHQGNLRLIEMGPGMDPGQSFAYDLFTKYLNLELTLVEELTLSNGIVLLVYDIQGNFEPMEWN